MTDGRATSAVPGVDWVSFAPSRRLGATEWLVWSVGLLRSAGFPLSGLQRLGGGQAARMATDHRQGIVDYDEFVHAYDADGLAESAQLAELADDSQLRLAIAWQNRVVYSHLDSLAAGRLHGSRQRQHERTLALYWQRYCAKAETIGFFGPAAWVSVGAGTQAVQIEIGASLTTNIRVSFEHWAIAELAGWMVAQPGARWWFAPMLRPDVHLAGDQLLVPAQAAVPLASDESVVLGYADGTRSAAAIVAALIADRHWDGPTARGRVERVLHRLLRHRLLSWDANIPVDVRAEAVLRARVAGIGDPNLHERCLAVLTELDAFRSEVECCEDATTLVEALDRFDDFFRRTTGKASSQENGKMYAGRTLCYPDALRDCRMSLGQDFLDQISAPLGLVADSADWFVDRVCDLVETEISQLVRAADTGRRRVTLADIWTDVLQLFWGQDRAWLDAVAGQYSRRWRELLELDPSERSAEVRRSASSLAGRAARIFGTGPRRWPHLAIHSPDLLVSAASVDAINAGDYVVVLGELHACMSTLDLPFLDWTTGDGSVRDKLNAAIDSPRLVPLLPPGWRRNTGRLVPAPIGTGDRLIGFTRAPFTDRSRVDPTTAIELTEANGRVTGTTPDGRVWPIPELLGVLISIVAADAFKIGLSEADSPRICVDRLVLFRRSWKRTVRSIELPPSPDRYRDFLAVQSWRAAHGMPERVFAKFPRETKPLLVDFASPILVLSFVNLVRAATRLDSDAVVSLSEALPELSHSWLPDAHGERYVAELRLQISKPVLR